jgi:D-alanine transaminase
VFAMCSPLKPPSPEARTQGVACVTADDFRWQKAHIKSTSLLGSVMARQISADVGANETIMFRDGLLSEAAASNVWVVKNGTLMGPPKSNLVLEGIRYDLIEEICQAQNISYILKDISREEVFTCDELLLSSATKEVLPVTLLDGQPIGHVSHRGAPGPMYQKLYAGYQTVKSA